MSGLSFTCGLILYKITYRNLPTSQFHFDLILWFQYKNVILIQALIMTFFYQWCVIQHLLGPTLYYIYNYLYQHRISYSPNIGFNIMTTVGLPINLFEIRNYILNAYRSRLTSSYFSTNSSLYLKLNLGSTVFRLFYIRFY